MKGLFGEIETFCMFIGYPRSGHSLIGSLLDAHPNMIIAHEQDLLGHIQAGFGRDQVYYLLLRNSRVFTQAGRTWHGYSYRVPNQWQGRFKRLQVIGDKQAGASTERLGSDPELLKLLQDVIDANIKFVHVVRNPYDMISTTYKSRKRPYWHSVRQYLILEFLRSGHRRLLGTLSSLDGRRHRSAPHSNMNETGSNTNLMDDIEYYFSLCETVADLKRQIKSVDILDVRHESFIENPRSCLKEICLFLEVDPLDDYLDDCASIVRQSSHKSRYDVRWEREFIDIVKNKLVEFAFLEGYSYEV
jgi:hypothetical protein